MQKETFIIRTEWMHAILELPEADQATIFKNLFYFHSDQKNLINLNNLSVKLVWRLIEPNLCRNIESYDKRKETSRENGRLGGRPSSKPVEPEPVTPPADQNEGGENNLNNLKKPNETLSVLVLDSVPVIDSVLVNTSTSDFEKFWNEYDKKVGEKEKLRKKWDALPAADKLAIFEFIPKYKQAEPFKKFRKNPETFLNNRSWLDEIITNDQNEKNETTQANQKFIARNNAKGGINDALASFSRARSSLDTGNGYNPA